MGFPLPCLITRMYMGEKTWNNEKLCSIMKNSPLHLLQSCMTPFAANAQPGPIFQSVTTALQHVEAAGHTPLPPLQCCKPPGQDTKYQAETEPSAIVNSPGMPWAECAKFQKNLSSTMFKQWAFDDHFFYNIYNIYILYCIHETVSFKLNLVLLLLTESLVEFNCGTTTGAKRNKQWPVIFSNDFKLKLSV